MTTRRYRGTLAVASLLLLLLPAMALAQSGEKDVGELAGFGGGGFGLGGSHGVVGGSSGIAFARNGMALLEAAYMPLGTDVLHPRTDYLSPSNSRLYDINMSIHIRIPVRERFAPYVILGGGLLWSQYEATPATALRPSTRVSRDEYRFGFHTGVGFRYYVGENWGFRPEYKAIISGSQTYSRFTVGVFYVLPALWP